MPSVPVGAIMLRFSVRSISRFVGGCERILRGVAAKGEVVGFDFVEAAPQYDPTEVTAQLAAGVILDFLGAIFRERQKRQMRTGDS